MTPLELKRIRACPRCGRGVAELETPTRVLVRVVLDAVRVRELAGVDDGLPALSGMLLAALERAGTPATGVVLDAIPQGLRGLVTVGGGPAGDVVACTAQEAIDLAVRGGLRLYATDEALAAAAGAARTDHDPGHTVH